MIIARMVMLLLVAASSAWGRQWYVSRTGTENPSGTASQPWAWWFAMSGGDGMIQPGDTVLFQGGVYDGAQSYTSGGTDFGYGQQGYFCDLAGTPGAPIVLMPVPGDQTEFNVNASPASAVMVVYGSYVNLTGLIFRCTASPGTIMDGVRFYEPDHAFPGSGHGNKLINCIVIGATNNGVADQDAEGTELYGNIIVNSGRRTSGGNAYAIYGQNHYPSRKLYEENAIFSTFAEYPLHLYGTEAAVDNLTLRGNVIANSVASSRLMFSSALHGPEGIEVLGNYWWGRSAGEIVLEERKGLTGPIYRDNYLMRGLISFRSSTTGRIFEGNYVWGAQPIVTTSGGSPPWPPFDISSAPANTWLVSGQGSSLSKVFLHVNRYEAGRAMIVVYNMPGWASIGVNLAGVVIQGGAFSVYDAQNILGPAVLSGSYAGGEVTIPVTQTAVTPPGSSHPSFPAPSHTGREFAVFIVRGEPDPLPIVLTSFTGRAIGAGRVLLEWGTLSEISNYGFTVRRRAEWEGVYSELGFIPGHQHSTEPRSYSFTDSMITQGGRYYYELFQRELDGGGFTYDGVVVDVVVSSVADVQIGRATRLVRALELGGVLQVELELAARERVVLDVYDIIGRVVGVARLDGGPGLIRTQVRLSSVAAGVYIVRMQAGDVIGTQRFIVMR